MLSKKSWNVYSPANRARVARDEALAEAAARDKERLDRDGEAEARMAQLRGQAERREIDGQARSTLEDDAASKATRGESRKRKRLPGEDDTDRDLRHAQERANGGRGVAVARLRATKKEQAEAPITDQRGNINLFPETKKEHGVPRRLTEEDKEKSRQKEAEENLGMPLKAALGREASSRTWYMDTDGTVKDREGRDVWGNEDPRRLQRDSRRVASADPLAFMKQAQTRLKEVHRERRVREQELEASRRQRDVDFEDFSLDGPAVGDERRESSRKHKNRHRDAHSGSRRDKRGDERRRRDYVEGGEGEP